MDIFVVFNTAFFNNSGDEIVKRRFIAINYLQGMFFIDFVSSVPFNLMIPENSGNSAHVIKVVNILKVVRILRLTKIINKMRIPEDIKAVSVIYFEYFSFPFSK